MRKTTQTGGLAQHWDAAYAQGELTRSWFEAEPSMSLRMLDAAGVGDTNSVIDVGGGSSRLADALLSRGHGDVTVLDISGTALGIARNRLGAAAGRVHWILGDLDQWYPERRYDAWHDRAVLHFLTGPAQQSHYLAALHGATSVGSVAVFGCFAADGPTQCSGLPVVRRSPGQLAAFLGPGWRMVTEERQEHPTPSAGTQSFTWAAFRRADHPDPRPSVPEHPTSSGD